MIINGKDIYFRCSGVGHLMTEAKTKADKEAGLLGQTAKTFVEDVFLRIEYDYQEALFTKEILKGHLAEQDSVALVQKVLGGEFRIKNTKTFNNEIIKGTPDIILQKEDVVEDTKTCWGIKSFFNAELNPLYYWQGMSYMKLTGKNHYRLIYCLVNTPEEQVIEEKKRWFYFFGCNEENKDYIKVCDQLDLNHNFDRIPAEQRIKIFNFSFSNLEYSKLEDKCMKGFEYYSTLKL